MKSWPAAEPGRAGRVGREVGETLEKAGLFYFRFMDDILVLAPTRWKLRTAVKVVNQVLASLRLEKHPDKTFIGRIEKGFDWLGYHIRPDGLSIATKTLQNFVTRIRALIIGSATFGRLR
jgi:hypothetical protein